MSIFLRIIMCCFSAITYGKSRCLENGAVQPMRFRCSFESTSSIFRRRNLGREIRKIEVERKTCVLGPGAEPSSGNVARTRTRHTSEAEPSRCPRQAWTDAQHMNSPLLKQTHEQTSK
jgi:hypothetical protein